MNETKATILKDSIDKHGNRLTTFRLIYPRIILSELNTHRLFCLDGDSNLEFNFHNQLHKLTIRDFVTKWYNGIKEPLFYNKNIINEINPNSLYTIVDLSKYQASSIIETACETGGINCIKDSNTFKIKGSDYIEYYINLGKSKISIKDRLSLMEIKQFNELTTTIQFAHVKNCFISGEKEVFEVKAKEYKIAGSKDHRLLTQFGWKPICDLVIGEDCLLSDRLDFIRIESITSLGIKDTYDLEIDGEFPNFIANGVVVHNSRNSSSSRAIPVKDNIEKVLLDPFIPDTWVKNARGMYSLENVNFNYNDDLERIWIDAASYARKYAKELADNELHKQYANRLLEAFIYMDTILSATDFDNFFYLRTQHDAQPEIRVLSELMYKEYINSTPTLLKYGQWHLPYIDTKIDNDDIQYSVDENVLDLDTAISVSVSCCAQVSYRKLDTSIEKALSIYNKLVSSKTVHACFDKNTQFLTKTGWIKALNYNGTSEIAVVIPGTNEIFFEKPFQYNIYDDVKKMVRIDGYQVDLLTTFNHRHYVSKRIENEWQPFGIEPSVDILNSKSSRKYLKAGIYKSTGVTYPIDFRLLGMYLSEGIEYKSIVKFHLRQQRKIDYLYSIDPNMLSITRNEYVLSNECGNWLFSNCRSNDHNEKKLPDTYIDMSFDQWNLLKDGLIQSNGFIANGCTIFSTTSEILAEQIQTLAHLHGETCALMFNSCRDLVRLVISNRTMPEVTYSITPVNYNDTVYCPTVSTGLVLVKRNNKIVISGNSALEHAATPFSDIEYDLRFELKQIAKQRLGNEITDLDLDKFLYKRNFKGWTQYRTKIPNETFASKFEL